MNSEVKYMKNKYRALRNQIFTLGEYSITPIRYEDRLKIMGWRNEQIYHLRQAKPLTEEEQTNYFNHVISKLFMQEYPNQVLFSYLHQGDCIGYGGLVHINWDDKHAEISFVMNTILEKDNFEKHWQTFLSLIEHIAFDELYLHKIFTYAFDLRPHLYTAIEGVGYEKEAILSDHCFFNGEYKDVIIHSKLKSKRYYCKPATKNDAKLLYDWSNEPSVRSNSFNSEPIEWEDHVKWFNKKLESHTTKIFILYQGITPLGQVRLDFVNRCWEIAYSIDKNYRGKGLGKKIIEIAQSKIPQNTTLKASVKNENIASIKVFKQLGFEVMDGGFPSVSTFTKSI